MKSSRRNIISAACLLLVAANCFGQGKGQIVLGAISLLADVQSLTTGLTLKQTAADSFAEVTVLGISTSDGPHPSTGLFSASSMSSVSVGGASATGSAEATIGNWEPFSSSGTVLSVDPTVATAASVNGNPASASASATAAINGHVASKKVIAPPPAVAAAATEIVPVLFALRFENIEASVSKKYTFKFGVSGIDSQSMGNIIFAEGQIGGGNTFVAFPFLASINPALSGQLNAQFLATFRSDANGGISVSSYLLGEGLLPTDSENVSGFVYNTTLDQEYIINANLDALATAAVPEPGAYGILGGVTLVAVLIARRRSRKNRLLSL